MVIIYRSVVEANIQASLTEDIVQFKGLRHMPTELNDDDGDGTKSYLEETVLSGTINVI